YGSRTSTHQNSAPCSELRRVRRAEIWRLLLRLLFLLCRQQSRRLCWKTKPFAANWASRSPARRPPIHRAALRLTRTSSTKLLASHGAAVRPPRKQPTTSSDFGRFRATTR